MKKRWIFSLVLIAVLAFAGMSSSFAAPAIGGSSEAEVTRIGDVEALKEKHRTRMTLVIETYAPEMLASYQTAWDAHDAVHVQLEAIKQERKAEIQAEVAVIRAKVESGELTLEEAKAELLTLEEAKAELLTLREANKAEHEAIRAEIEALKATYGQDPEVVKVAKEALKVAVKAKDEAEIVRLLGDLLAMLEKHITFDNMKLDVLN